MDRTLRWILPAAAAVLLGFGAGRLVSSASTPRPSSSPHDETAMAWKVRDAARTRLELRLRERIARSAWIEARAEAEALAVLDPFNAEARAFLKREPAAGPSAADGAGRIGDTKGASAYEEARREVRRRVFEAIDSGFPDAAIAAAIRKYAWEGRLDPATEDLRKLLRSRSDDSAAIAELIGGLRHIASRLEAGRLAWADGRLAEADPLWHEAFAAERRLLPEGVTSVPVREARRHLAQGWYQEGRRLEARDQRDAAVAAWRKGLAADPSDLDLRTALQRAMERPVDGGTKASPPSVIRR